MATQTDLVISLALQDSLRMACSDIRATMKLGAYFDAVADMRAQRGWAKDIVRVMLERGEGRTARRLVKRSVRWAIADAKGN